MAGPTFIAALAGAALLASAVSAPAATGERLPLEIAGPEGSHTFMVELAVTPEARSRGLMFRREMGEDEGMLFDFDTEREITMWMRNTYLPLDMVFIGEDGTVKSIARSTTPLSERIISSNVPARYVLEINAGRAAATGVRPGARVSGAAMDALTR